MSDTNSAVQTNQNETKKLSVSGIIKDVIFWGVLLGLIFSIFYFKLHYVATGSMEPTITTGAFIVVNPHDDVEVGDVAMYKAGTNGYVVHRIIDVDENGDYIFKGDNNETADMEAISKERIVGPVVFHANWLSPLFKAIHHLG